MTRALIVAAHPDDEVLMCGGSIARHVRRGDEVFVAVLGEGVTARFDATPADVARIARCFETAMEVLNAKLLPYAHCRSLPDNRFDSLDLLMLVREVESVCEHARPDIVYTHHAGDLNIDHALTARAVLTACRPIGGGAPAEILAGESLSSTEWALPGQAFVPTVFVRLDEAEVAKKLAALACYESEVRPFPHPRSVEAARAQLALRGSQCGHPAAEAFECMRIVR